jgi:hypothetical protein
MGASARRIAESEQTRCLLEQEPGLPDLLLHPARGDGWTVDLLNDRGERKATGSYYTPDYLVKYIVEATVDLAKLSLWLATVARDRPLSFLDHHLRCGNSLVGARITSLQPAGGKKRKKAEDETQLSMLGDDAGFDAVVGNPPYVRQVSLGDLKPYLASSYPEVYHGVADLYVYFYQQGLRQLRRGGLMSFIVTNKWLRAGYGEPLREYFASEGVIEEIVDFGHAPIFEDTDVFPCIVLLRKPLRDEPEEDRGVRVVEFPREALSADIATYVRENAHTVPRKRFGKNAWCLETSAVDVLMEKIRENGVPLAEYVSVQLYRGVVTGFNEAFLIDTLEREQLIREDPRSAKIIKPYLRGYDVKRWSPEWNGLRRRRWGV